MALSINDILQLQSLQHLELVAGDKGLNKWVTSAGIVDYEFVPDINYPEENAFEKDSIVLSSLLFAKDNESLIFPAIKSLYNSGVACFAYKCVLFDMLPKEVIDFANKNKFAIFKFGTDVYFENIIFEVMDAVQCEDTIFLTENNIKKMIEEQLTKSQVYSISKSISLSFKEYAMAVYIKENSNDFQLHINRVFRNFYLNRSLKDKALLCRYENGLFAIITASHCKEESFKLILKEMLDFLSLEGDDLYVSCSSIHQAYGELDCCLRESYHTHIASNIENRKYLDYSHIGIYQVLIPNKDSQIMRSFMNRNLNPLIGKPDLFETIKVLVLNNGDFYKTACDFGCHQNTIRYRISKIKELLSVESTTDQEFYSNISMAIKLYLLRSAE